MSPKRSTFRPKNADQQAPSEHGLTTSAIPCSTSSHSNTNFKPKSVEESSVDGAIILCSYYLFVTSPDFDIIVLFKPQTKQHSSFVNLLLFLQPINLSQF